MGTPGNAPYPSRGNTIHVWTPQGVAIWEKTYAWDPDGGPVDACMNENNLDAPGVGDVNGDGIADVVFLTSDGKLHVLDGRNGNVIWETLLPAGQDCPVWPAPSGCSPRCSTSTGTARTRFW